MAQKKTSTSSFAIEKVIRTTRNASLQLQNKFEHQINTKFSSMINNSIRKLSETQTTCRWQLEKLQEKRKLHGLKVKLRWRDLQSKHSVLMKLCVPSNYDNIKTSKACDPDDFILEVESINFNMAVKRIKTLQNFLDDQMKKYLRIPLGKSNASDDWLISILENVSTMLSAEDKSEFKDKLEILTEEPVVKALVNENYIVCPSPMTIAWSPQGILTVSTHNSVPRVRGSYIGTRKFLNFAFQGGKSSPALTSRQDNQIFQQISEIEQTEPTSLYHWSIDQNLDFMDKSSGKIQQTLQANTFQDQTRKNPHRKHRNTQYKKSDVALLVDLSKTPPELAKLYRQHFSRQAGDQHMQGSHERIRLFRIEGEDKELENDLMFMLYRAADHKDRPEIQTIVKNELCGYVKILQNPADPIQYRIMAKLLSDKLRSTKHLPLYLKAMMVENDIISQLLSKHFSSMATKLSIVPSQLKSVTALNLSLGSYLHFQYLRAQSILFEILRIILLHPSSHSDLSKRFIVRTIKNVMKFQLPMILTESQSVQFYRRVIPILELRNRNASYLQYRKIMRIILANDQLRNFIRVMNELVELYYDPTQKEFLKTIVASYFQKQESLAQQKPSVRRMFRVECLRCGSTADGFELFGQQDLKCDACCSIIR